MSWTKQVYSTNVSEISYDEESQEMTVRFQKGASYAYEGVDEQTALDMANAASVTQFLNSEIKGRYNYRKL